VDLEEGVPEHVVGRHRGARPEVLHWPNVLRVRSRLRKIERLVQTREVE
jgi:hypothetical protein